MRMAIGVAFVLIKAITAVEVQTESVEASILTVGQGTVIYDIIVSQTFTYSISKMFNIIGALFIIWGLITILKGVNNNEKPY